MLEVSHLQFADDTIFFSSDDKKFGNLVKGLFCCGLLCCVSGLQLNLSNSCIFGINCIKDKMVSLTNSLRCDVGT